MTWIPRARNWLIPDAYTRVANDPKRECVLKLCPRYSTPWGQRAEGPEAPAVDGARSVRSNPWLVKYVPRQTFKG